MISIKKAYEKYMAIPPTVPDGGGKLYTLGNFAWPMTIANHALFVIVFFAIGVYGLCLYNVLSVAVFSFNVYLNRRGRFSLSMLLYFIEMHAFVSLSIATLGWDFGFQYWLFVNAAVVMFTPWSAKLKTALLSAFAVFDFFILAFLQRPDVAPFDPVIARSISFMNIAATLGSIALVTYFYISIAERAERGLALENKRSEALLRNILPQAIAEKLKDSPGTIVESYADCSILFADIAGFTAFSSSVPPVDLIELLNRLFSKFDELTGRYGLEKIKTIGDAYMVASGIPVPRGDHAKTLARFALDMREAVAEFNRQEGTGFQLRIGIHAGPAIAGIIGTMKFSYDIWGDSVNTASRMESNGVPGKIHISEEFHRRLGDGFSIDDRGHIDVKGKGTMHTFFLMGEAATAAT